jgi:hypothetical protein
VDASHLKIMETDTVPVLAGDAFRQPATLTNASLSGSQAFTIGGAQGIAPFAAGGIFSADGAGNITTGVEDFNSGGSTTRNLPLTGTYAIAASGRGTLTLNTGTGLANFVIYPSSGGLQMLETDVTTISSGAALSQQAGTFSAASLTGAFAWNLSGVSAGGEVDQNLQLTLDGTSLLNGSLDVNNAGLLSSSLSAAGTYTVAANGHGTMVVRSSVGTQSFLIYAVSNSRALFIEIDVNLIGGGVMEHQ